MNTEIKNALMHTFYDRILNREYEDEWALTSPHLDEALDYLFSLDNQDEALAFLDLTEQVRDDAKTHVVMSILNHFHGKYTPELEDDNLVLIDEAYAFELKKHSLPDANYSVRTVTSSACNGLVLYQRQALEKIQAFIDENLDDPNVDKLREDYEKIRQLERVSIPQSSGGNKGFYTLAESAGGVTEKVSLIGRRHALFRLKALVETPLTKQQYLQNRNDYKLSTQAILKLPKHGDVKEVQRELIALNISDILGFRTTKRNMVEFDGKAALFVPFDNIQLMSDFVHGETKHARLGSFGKEYLNYSTFKPVGEGVCAEQTIDDPGMSLGFFYLCSDTDAFGGYNQNKALYNGKEWYVFDQVVMDKEKLALDSRFSMQPVQSIMKHTRHGQGRNRTLVEDALFENKFASLYHIQNKKNLIEAMLDDVIVKHDRAIHTLSSKPRLTDSEQQQLKELRVLDKDAVKIKGVILNRIDNALSILPDFTNQTESEVPSGKQGKIIMHAMMLEKLLNKPVLFTDDGRPYRQPWTYRPNQQLKSIKFLGDVRGKERLELNFSSDMDPALLSSIVRALGHGDSQFPSTRKLTVSVDLLYQINDRMLFSEHSMSLDNSHDYLSLRDLEQLATHYPDGSGQAECLDLINTFNTRYDEAKIKTIEDTLERIQQIKPLIKNKGFICHVEKRFNYSLGQKLKVAMNGRVPINFDDAFAAAVKLDRLAEFNQVCLEAVKNDKVQDAAFIHFIDDSVVLGQGASNYHESQRNSQTMHENAEGCIGALHQHDEVIGMGMDDLSQTEDRSHQLSL